MIENVKSSEPFQYVQRQTKPLRLFVRKFVNDWSFDLASMLAYNILISLLPIAVILFSVLGFILKNDLETQEDLKNKIIRSFPSDNATQTGIRQIVDLAFNQLSSDVGGIFVTGLLFALIASSRLFVAIDTSMTIIYRLPQRTFLRQALISIGILMIFVIIVVFMLSVSSIPSIVMNLIPGDGGRFGIFLVGLLLSSFIAFSLFEILYLITPNKKMSWKKTWCGSLVAAGILEIFIILFPLYVRYFMGNYAGQIGFAIILILFFYYFSIIFILGAQINSFFFEHHQPFDQPMGTVINQIHHQQTDDQFQRSTENNQRNRWIHQLCLCQRKQTVHPVEESQ